MNFIFEWLCERGNNFWLFLLSSLFFVVIYCATIGVNRCTVLIVDLLACCGINSVCNLQFIFFMYETQQLLRILIWGLITIFNFEMWNLPFWLADAIKTFLRLCVLHLMKFHLTSILDIKNHPTFRSILTYSKSAAEDCCSSASHQRSLRQNCSRSPPNPPPTAPGSSRSASAQPPSAVLPYSPSSMAEQSQIPQFHHSCD